MTNKSIDKAKPHAEASRRIPKQARSQKTVAKILAATAELIAQSDTGKTSTHKIAKQAGISVGSIYQFFPDIGAIEMALVAQVMDKFYEHLVTMLEAKPQATDFVEASERLVAATHDFYHKHPDTVRAITACRYCEAFHKENDALNLKIIELLTSRLVAVGLALPRSEIRRKVLIGVMVSDVMTMLIWTAEDDTERTALLKEWKVLTGAYTSKSVDR